MGADIYSRVIYGARITLIIAFVAVGAALLIGVPVGLWAGWNEFWIGEALMRVSDVVSGRTPDRARDRHRADLGSLDRECDSRPVDHLLALVRAPGLRRGTLTEARNVYRGRRLRSVYPSGASLCSMCFPMWLSPIIVRTSIGMGFTILTAAALGFLGLGAPLPAPEWGRMISESREFLPEAWWYALAPGLAIFAVVMGFNLWRRSA